MTISSWLLGDFILTKELRSYSQKYVKITRADRTRGKELVREYVEGRIMQYCREHSTLPILRLVYTGSAYERLKTEAFDEVDFMVVLETYWSLWSGSEVDVEDTGIPGYVRLKAREASKLRHYASPDGYINAKRLQSGWLFSIITQAVNFFNKNFPCSDVSFIVRAHGPAVQLDLIERRTNKRLLSVDLVVCFKSETFEKGDFFVPKTCSAFGVYEPEHLWRCSFSLGEKEMLQRMDKYDKGCRHELLRIVKTIVNRERTSLGKLESYHLKTAFIHYIEKKREDWGHRNSLGKHFVSFLEELQCHLLSGSLPHFYLRDVNLLDDINPVIVEKMGNRVERILNSEAKLNQILRFESVVQEESFMTVPRDLQCDISYLSFGLELVLLMLDLVSACIFFIVKLIMIVLGLALLLVILMSIEHPSGSQPKT
ncbi:cyclic GMP-AMP synthase-like receptor 3 [Montipora capricornis]|uniref:cyclic GMP-AMP synthase-like receptor 3 n=1 Tax=Montipora capricornis TaxID=246305 RepID=UPI0035F179AF